MASRRSPFDVFGVAAMVILALCALSIGATVLAAFLRLALTSAIALAVALTPSLVVWYARRRLGARGPIYVAAATSVAVPFVFLGAASALSEPILHDFRCGLGLLGFAFAAPFALALFGLPVALATWLLVRRERPSVDRAVRYVALAAGVCASVLVVFAAMRRSQRPEASKYVASLPVVVELGPEAWRPAVLADLPVNKDFSGPPLTSASRAEVPGGPVVYRGCRDDGACQLWIAGRASKPSPSTSWTRADTTLAIRRDAAHDLYVIDGTGPRLAIYGDGRTRMPLYPRDVLSSLAAPRDWIVGSALGVVVAFALLWRGRSRESAASAVRWREGFVTGAGSVVFGDGRSIASPPDLAEGTPVTAVLRDDAGETFRSLPELSAVAPGTLADRAAEARAEATSDAAHALLVIAATSAPLVACIVHRVTF